MLADTDGLSGADSAVDVICAEATCACADTSKEVRLLAGVETGSGGVEETTDARLGAALLGCDGNSGLESVEANADAMSATDFRFMG